jgi:hypothetical protein
MLGLKGKISILVLMLLFSVHATSALGEKPKGSRLYIKPNTVSNTKLTFTKGKPVLPFSKIKSTTLEIKPGQTANLYFSNLLLTRNLPKSTGEIVAKTILATTETKVAENKPAKNTETIEPGERLYYSENLQITNAYPNPADDYAYLDYHFNGGFNNVKITVFNVLGTPTNVGTQLDRNDRKTKLYVKDLNSGIYFYQLIADGKTLATKKLLVRHNN